MMSIKRRFEVEDSKEIYKTAILKNAIYKSYIRKVDDSSSFILELTANMTEILDKEFMIYDINIIKLSDGFIKVVYNPCSYLSFIIKESKICYITVDISNYVIPYIIINQLKEIYDISNILIIYSKPLISYEISELQENINIFHIMSECKTFINYIIINNSEKSIIINTDFVERIKKIYSDSDFQSILITTCSPKPLKISYEKSFSFIMQISGCFSDYSKFI